jgi:MerR family transcriptional regulator, thiopeptide resistance regulator
MTQRHSLLLFMMVYTIKKLADLAGVSIRTLHYYDEIGLLKPDTHNASGYRLYGEEAVVRLQQVLFFRELGFNLEEIRKIMSRSDFDVLEALQSHRVLLTKRAERLKELLNTVDKTIQKLKGEITMPIKDYYEGFSDKQIERYRQEVRQRWGDQTLKDSEARVMAMGTKKFAALQAEGGAIFQAISDKMSKGFDSQDIQELVAKWRVWLENFHTYSDEAILGLGQTYSQHPEFAKFFEKINKDLPAFLTKAIEYYSQHKKS